MKPKKWECESVDKLYQPTPEVEMQQRLAEVLEILLTGTCQPTKSVFSKELLKSCVPRIDQTKRGA